MSAETPDAPRAVIVISSHVARGSVGNRAAVFALETLGFPVWAVPTVILPWHPGHGRATRIVPPLDQFTALMADLERAPWLGEVGAVLSGYLGEAGQAEAVASLVAAVKARTPDAVYICDPVMGDSGGLYVPEPTAAAMRDRLMPIADIATPNRYELEWMAGAHARRPEIGDRGGTPRRTVDHAGHLGTVDDDGRHRQSAARRHPGAARRTPPDRQAAERPGRPDGGRLPGRHPVPASRRSRRCSRPRRRSTRSWRAPPSAAATSCSSKPTRRACRIRWPWCSCAISPIRAGTARLSAVFGGAQRLVQRFIHAIVIRPGDFH